MKTSRAQHLLIGLLVFFLSILACGGGSNFTEPTAPIAPITIGADLSQIDLCAAIPQEDIEAVMGRTLVSPPEAFEMYDTPGSTGCAYDAGSDSGAAYFGYVALTPIDAYDHQPRYKDTKVEGIGSEAYFNNGPDARQLWVKIEGKVAFVVAFGDEPNEQGAEAIARLLVNAIK